MIGLALVATLLAILGAYPIPAALNTYAHQRHYGPAFHLASLLSAIRDHAPAYHIAYRWAALSALAALAWQATVFAHLIGLFAIPFLGFYLQLAWAHLFAQALADESPLPLGEG
jgi:hypothetical protein